MSHALTTFRIGAMVALALVAGCSTLHARSTPEARRASLLVLCTDPDIDVPATWCREVATSEAKPFNSRVRR
jgi:hypothetical protein